MVKRILIGLALLINTLLIFTAPRRAKFWVQRSLDRRAPPQHNFPFIDALGF